MPEFATLEKVDLREGWPKEAADFTPWLAENLSRLGDALGMELELRSREAAVGAFSLDLLAHDLTQDRAVVIENQLETTNHDHLGKLLTYAAGFDASVVIWVARTIRDEHRQALDWLNQRTGESTEFFGIAVELLKIDDSRLAPNFKLIAFPNEWQKANNPPSRGPAVASEKRGEAYRTYFQGLFDELHERHNFTGPRKAQSRSFCGFSTGFPGITYGTSFAAGSRVRLGLYIDQGDKELNKALYDGLENSKNHIEAEFGETFEWERLDNRRASQIAIYRPGSIDNDLGVLEEIKEWAIERLLRLKEVFPPKLDELMKQ